MQTPNREPTTEVREQLKQKYCVSYGQLGVIIQSREDAKAGKKLLETGIDLWDFVADLLAKEHTHTIEEAKATITRIALLPEPNPFGTTLTVKRHNQVVKEVLAALTNQGEK